MQKLGFDDKWCDLIMMCVTTVSYSMKINGKPKGHIVLSRGIRQGDSLSPYLFLLCAEGLSTLIKKEVENGRLGRVAVCQRSPKISHLFFADDSWIFCRASLKECDALQGASGQQLNRAKISLFFSRMFQFMLLSIIWIYQERCTV